MKHPVNECRIINTHYEACQLEFRATKFRKAHSVAYETQKQTCDLLNAGNANTQRIIDVLNGHWNDELQRKYADAQLELSQMRQNAYLISQLKTTATT